MAGLFGSGSPLGDVRQHGAARGPRSKVHPSQRAIDGASTSLDDMSLEADADASTGPRSPTKRSYQHPRASGSFFGLRSDTIARAMRRFSGFMSSQGDAGGVRGGDDGLAHRASTNAEMLAKMPCSRRLEFLDEISFLDDGLKLSLYNVLVSTGVSKWKVRHLSNALSL